MSSHNCSHTGILGYFSEIFLMLHMMHFGGPHLQGTAITVLSEKLPKWHFSTLAWNSIFWGEGGRRVPYDFIWGAMKVLYESALYWIYPKYVSGTVQALIWEDIEVNWIISRISWWISRNIFVSGCCSLRKQKPFYLSWCENIDKEIHQQMFRCR